MNAGHDHSYDLYLRPDGAGFVWSIPDHGVTLDRARMTFVQGRESCAFALSDIAAVHLQTNAVGQAILGTCRIVLRDSSAVSVLSCGSNGLYDGKQAALYGQFVRDLHVRLAALPDATIDFTAGYSANRLRFGMAALIVAVAFFIVLPTVLLVMTKELSLIGCLYFGVFLIWPLWRLINTNTPSRYEPGAPPSELIDL